MLFLSFQCRNWGFRPLVRRTTELKLNPSTETTVLNECKMTSCLFRLSLERFILERSLHKIRGKLTRWKKYDHLNFCFFFSKFAFPSPDTRNECDFMSQCLVVSCDYGHGNSLVITQPFCELCSKPLQFCVLRSKIRMKDFSKQKLVHLS